MKENKKYYYPCECGAELIQLEVEKDERLGKDVCFAMFECGKREFSWNFKLRHIWKIIKTGTPYSDSVILSFKRARKMARDILRETKEEEKTDA